MNVLILGGNGYLGSKLIKAMIDDHNIVFTKRAASNLERLEGLLDRVKAIPATVEAVETAMEYEKFDLILNAACNYGRRKKFTPPHVS